MTTFSLSLRLFPREVTSEQLESALTEAEVLWRMGRHAREVGPYGLSRWAEKRGLPVHYVDPLWVRVPVGLEDLRAFCRDVLKSEAIPGFLPQERLAVIEADEF
ncbi:MAG TPA: hypothetical protein VF699_05750 [Caulobacteraceae bacterium]|jgi:hypothetical protein